MMLEDGEWNETIKSTRVDDDVRIGSISYSFTWTNFTVVDADRIYFGDAFTTDDGVWFPILDDGQRLIVESPSNYGVDTAPAGARVQSGEVIHDGYTELTSNDLEIVFLRSSGAEPSTPPEPNEPSPHRSPLKSPSCRRIVSALASPWLRYSLCSCSSLSAGTSVQSGRSMGRLKRPRVRFGTRDRLRTR